MDQYMDVANATADLGALVVFFCFRIGDRTRRCSPSNEIKYDDAESARNQLNGNQRGNASSVVQTERILRTHR